MKVKQAGWNSNFKVLGFNSTRNRIFAYHFITTVFYRLAHSLFDDVIITFGKNAKSMIQILSNLSKQIQIILLFELGNDIMVSLVTY